MNSGQRDSAQETPKEITIPVGAYSGNTGSAIQETRYEFREKGLTTTPKPIKKNNPYENDHLVSVFDFLEHTHIRL